eukprot:4446239-Pyramimonas_sp.AAC.1
MEGGADVITVIRNFLKPCENIPASVMHDSGRVILARPTFKDEVLKPANKSLGRQYQSLTEDAMSWMG